MADPRYLIVIDREEDCVALVRMYPRAQRLVYLGYAVDEDGTIDSFNHQLLCSLEGLSYPLTQEQKEAVALLLSEDQMEFDSSMVYIPKEDLYHAPATPSEDVIFSAEPFFFEGDFTFPLY